MRVGRMNRVLIVLLSSALPSRGDTCVAGITKRNIKIVVHACLTGKVSGRCIIDLPAVGHILIASIGRAVDCPSCRVHNCSVDIVRGPGWIRTSISIAHMCSMPRIRIVLRLSGETCSIYGARCRTQNRAINIIRGSPRSPSTIVITRTRLMPVNRVVLRPCGNCIAVIGLMRDDGIVSRSCDIS